MNNQLELRIGPDKLPFVRIEAGGFLMGATDGLPLEMPPHWVDIRQPFYASAWPVTQRVWQTVMGSNPSAFDGDTRLPVDSVSWQEVQRFCRRLSSVTDRHVRMPTEAEWEYACRAGTTGEYFFDHERQAEDYAWYDMNSQDQTHPVGLKKPNPWGLFDIVGNLWEWCEDAWFADYRHATSDGSARAGDPAGRHTLRGGAWDMDVFRCRSAYRSFDFSHLGTSRFGCRVIIEERSAAPN